MLTQLWICIMGKDWTQVKDSACLKWFHMIIITGKVFVMLAVERHDNSILGSIKTYCLRQLGGWELQWVKRGKAWLQMESRGESHAGFLLHRDKQNSPKQERDMLIWGRNVWWECGRETRHHHWWCVRILEVSSSVQRSKEETWCWSMLMSQAIVCERNLRDCRWCTVRWQTQSLSQVKYIFIFKVWPKTQAVTIIWLYLGKFKFGKRYWSWENNMVQGLLSPTAKLYSARGKNIL